MPVKAPRNKTNQPTRRVALCLAPYQEEWLRAQSAIEFPASSGPGSVIDSPVSRFLRRLVDEEMERRAGSGEG